MRQNKFLTITVIILALIIIALLIVIIIELKKDNKPVKTEQAMQQGTLQNTERITEEQTELETERGIDLAVFKKGIYTVSGKSPESILLEGGVTLEITEITEDSVSFEYIVIQSPPANRIASIMIKDAKIENGVAKFSFDNDEWFNRGKGTLTFTENGKLKIRTQISHMDERAMWSIGEGQKSLKFYREKSTE